jgi:transposase-like protein
MEVVMGALDVAACLSVMGNGVGGVARGLVSAMSRETGSLGARIAARGLASVLPQLAEAGLAGSRRAVGGLFSRGTLIGGGVGYGFGLYGAQQAESEALRTESMAAVGRINPEVANEARRYASQSRGEALQMAIYGWLLDVLYPNGGPGTPRRPEHPPRTPLPGSVAAALGGELHLQSGAEGIIALRARFPEISSRHVGDEDFLSSLANRFGRDLLDAPRDARSAPVLAESAPTAPRREPSTYRLNDPEAQVLGLGAGPKRRALRNDLASGAGSVEDVLPQSRAAGLSAEGRGLVAKMREAIPRRGRWPEGVNAIEASARLAEVGNDIARYVSEAGGNVDEAARRLGMQPETLRRLQLAVDKSMAVVRPRVEIMLREMNFPEEEIRTTLSDSSNLRNVVQSLTDGDGNVRIHSRPGLCAAIEAAMAASGAAPGTCNMTARFEQMCGRR